MRGQRARRPLEQVPRGPERQADVRPVSERQAAEHCGYFDRECADPVRAFQKWARRWGVPVKRVGRARLYDPRVLDAFMDQESWTRRHKPGPQRAITLVHSAPPSQPRPQSVKDPAPRRALAAQQSRELAIRRGR